MKIAEFEEAFRAALGTGSMLPALAAPGLTDHLNIELPAEFKGAMSSLASRSGERQKEDSLLGSVAAQWS